MTTSTGTRKRWPKEIDGVILDMARSGLWPDTIERRLGVDRFKINKTFRKSDFKYPHEVRSAIAKATHAPRMAGYEPDLTARILEARNGGVPRREIAVLFGISINKVHSDIQRYGGGPLDPVLGKANQIVAATKYSEAQEKEAVRRRKAGESLEAIAAAMSLSVSAVRYLCSGTLLTSEQRSVNSGVRIHTKETEEEIVRRRLNGEMRDKISEELKVPLSKVKTVLRQRRVVMPGLRTLYSWEDVRRICREFDMIPINVPAEDGKVSDTFSHRWRIRCHCGREYAPFLNSFVRRMSRSCGCVKSHAEGEVADFIASLGFSIERNDRSLLAPLEIDVWVPDKRLAIEYNGLYWHGERLTSTRGRQALAYAKWKEAKDRGFRLVTIFEDEWIGRREAVEGFLRAILGVPASSIGARECSVVEGRNESEFLTRHHVQGAVPGRTWSLIDPSGETAACAVFALSNASRGSGPEGTELARYCVRSGLRVSGGLGRLLAAFRTASPEVKSLVSYSDNRWSQGGLYRALGFEEAGIGAPSYWYFRSGTQGPRCHRYGWRKQVALEKYGGDPERTEWDIMSDNGWDRVWDCGTTKWVKPL